MRLFVLVTLFLAFAMGLFGGAYADAEPEVTDKVFFDIQHGDKHVGQIVIGLFGKDVPKVCPFFHLPTFNAPIPKLD